MRQLRLFGIFRPPSIYTIEIDVVCINSIRKSKIKNLMKDIKKNI